MNAKYKGLPIRLLTLGVPATAVLLFTSFLAVPTIRSGPYPDSVEPAALVAPAGPDAEGLASAAPIRAITEATGALAWGATGADGSSEAEASPRSGSATAGAAGARARRAARAARGVSFRDQQMAFPRVARAFERKSARVASLFSGKQITRPAELYVRVFKREQELEVWARPLGGTRFVHLTTYPVCKISGRLGPKRQSGDGQIPEGYYTIDLFNPWSSYHLSMRVDYPNAVDAARGRRGSLGGNIFVHGGCATIGCVPITDSYIEELYVMAVEARSAGQRRIPIHIFPTRLDGAGMEYLRTSYGGDFVDYPLWQKLEEGYSAFESTRKLPRIRTTGGRYTVVPAAGSPVATRTR